MANVSIVPFHGAKLITTEKNNIVYVAMKPIVDAIGLDWKGQSKKLKNSQQKHGCGHMSIPTKGGIQEMLFIPLRKLNGWLFSINPEKVRSDLREKVIQYQEECFEVLHKHFMPKAAYAGDFEIPSQGSAAQYVRDYLIRYMEDYKNFIQKGIDFVPESIPLEVMQGIVVHQMQNFRMFTWFDDYSKELRHEVLGSCKRVVNTNNEKEVAQLIGEAVPKSMYPMIMGVIMKHYEKKEEHTHHRIEMLG